MVQIMDQQAQQKPISLEELQTIFEHVKDVYPAEFKLFECDAIALSQLLPVLAHSLATWDPLQAPLQWLHVFSSWKRLLSGDAAPTFAPQDGGDAAALPSGDAFSELCNEALLPPLRRVVMAVWDARAPLPLLQFFDHWMPVLPPATSAHVLRAMVLPRLQAAVNTWAADGAGPAVHVWLHPWLPHLSSELQHLFPMIRNKLSAMLKVLCPSLLTCLPRSVAVDVSTALCQAGRFQGEHARVCAGSLVTRFHTLCLTRHGRMHDTGRICTCRHGTSSAACLAHGTRFQQHQDPCRSERMACRYCRGSSEAHECGDTVPDIVDKRPFALVAAPQ